MGYDTPSPKPEARQFDSIVTSFDEKLTEAKNISTGIYDKVKSLQYFDLDVDQQKSEARPTSEGLVGVLQDMLYRLEYLNKRNTEILKHFNTLL